MPAFPKPKVVPKMVVTAFVNDDNLTRIGSKSALKLALQKMLSLKLSAAIKDNPVLIADNVDAHVLREENGDKVRKPVVIEIEVSKMEGLPPLEEFAKDFFESWRESFAGAHKNPPEFWVKVTYTDSVAIR